MLKKARHPNLIARSTNCIIDYVTDKNLDASRLTAVSSFIAPPHLPEQELYDRNASSESRAPTLQDFFCRCRCEEARIGRKRALTIIHARASGHYRVAAPLTTGCSSQRARFERFATDGLQLVIKILKLIQTPTYQQDASAYERCRQLRHDDC